MVNVLLVYFHYKDDLHHIPIGLLYIATYLEKNGFSVKINNYIKNFDEDLTREEYLELNNDLKDAVCVGFSVLTTQIQRSLSLSKYLKRKYKSLVIVWGGVHPTLFPEAVCYNENVDFVVVNEGENAFIDLVKVLSSNKKDFSNISNLVYKEGKEIKKNPQGELVDFVNSPIPDYDLLDDFIQKYSYYFFQGKKYKFVEVHTGRGCPYRCTFCLNNILFGKTRRSRSIESIIEEINLLKNRYNGTFFKFRDENFFMNKAYLEKFCDVLIDNKMNLKWWTSARSNFFDNVTPELMLKLKKSGCFHLLIGAESGSEKILKQIKKDIVPKQLIRSARICVKYKIVPNYSFMVGFPGENIHDIKATLKLMKRLKRISPYVNITGPHLLRPYPGGELYEELKGKYNDFFKNKTLEQWATTEKFSEIYLKPSDLPWINDPRLVDVVVNYAPRMFNSWVRVPFYVQFVGDVKSRFYTFGVYWFMSSKNKVVRWSALSYLHLLDSVKVKLRKLFRGYVNL